MRRSAALAALAVLCVASLTSPRTVAEVAKPAPTDDDLRSAAAALAALRTLSLGEPLGEVAPTTLTDGTRALTIVFRNTKWSFRGESQFLEESAARQMAAMKLPEVERLKVMTRTEDHVQVWLVSQAAYPAAASRKAHIPATALPNRYHRETAFLGTGSGFAWYMHAPIFTWMYVQKEIGLKGGDDPLAGALRGLEIDDPGGYTRNGCVLILGSAGPAALPYIEKAIASGYEDRNVLVYALRDSNDPQVTQWLLRRVDAADAKVAWGARNALISSPRQEAAALYVKWLEASATTRDPALSQLLDACKAAPGPGLEKALIEVFEKPWTPWDYRKAFGLLREVSGRPIPAAILEAEREIHRQYKEAAKHTYEPAGDDSWRVVYTGKPYDQKKVDEAVATIVKSNDPEAAAVIGVVLATSPEVKSCVPESCPPIRQVGLAILRGLPEGKGKQRVRRLAETVQGEFFPARIGALARELENGQP